MKTKLRTVIVFTVSLLWLISLKAVCLATTYYVDAINGDDANPGTSSAPWKTVDRAYTWYAGAGPKVQQGDTVIFRDGNYGVFRESTHDGQSRLFYRDNWITYKRDASHTPIITGIDIYNLDKWGGAGNGNSYLIFDGFDIPEGVGIQHTSYVQILNCKVTLPSLPHKGMYAPYLTPGGHGIRVRDSHYITIEDNEIFNVYRGIGFVESPDNVVIRNNVIHRIGEDGMSTGGSHLLLEGNFIYDIDMRRTTLSVWGTQQGQFIEGEKVIQEGTGAEGIVYSIPSANWISLLQTNEKNFDRESRGGGTVTGQTSGATLSSVDRDYAHTDGFQIHTTATDIVIRGNIVLRFGKGLAGQGFKLASYAGGSLTNVTLENNLIASGKPFTMSYVHGIDIINNTFIGVDGIEIYSEGTTIVNNMYNNIIERIVLRADTAGGDYVQIINHGNNIFGPGEKPHAFGGPSYTFAFNNTESVIQDFESLFVDAANYDYHLKEGSTAVDFGDPSHAPVIDILGNFRDSKPDAGCYEYGAAQKIREPEPDKTSFKCYNNVFNPKKGESALIIVELPNKAHVKLGLYNTRGNRIRELADEEKEAGTHKYYWDGKNDSGNVVGSGLYFVHIEAGDYKKTKKIVVVK